MSQFQEELDIVRAAKQKHVNADYGSDESFGSFITWHNLSFQYAKTIRSSGELLLFPFTFKNRKISINDLSDEIDRAKKFLSQKEGRKS